MTYRDALSERDVLQQGDCRRSRCRVECAVESLVENCIVARFNRRGVLSRTGADGVNVIPVELAAGVGALRKGFSVVQRCVRELRPSAGRVGGFGRVNFAEGRGVDQVGFAARDDRAAADNRKRFAAVEVARIAAAAQACGKINYALAAVVDEGTVVDDKAAVRAVNHQLINGVAVGGVGAVLDFGDRAVCRGDNSRRPRIGRTRGTRNREVAVLEGRVGCRLGQVIVAVGVRACVVSARNVNAARDDARNRDVLEGAVHAVEPENMRPCEVVT